MIVYEKAIPNTVLRHNIIAIIIGIAIAFTMSFFKYASSSHSTKWADVLTNLLFSLIISIAVANTVWIAEYVFSKSIKRFWVAVIGYYGGSILGVAIGHELSYVIVSHIYKFPYILGNHLNSLIMSLGISVIVCTVLFAYHMQKNRYAVLLNNRELEVIKLKQLKTQAELQTLQSKINPHFLYNALNSIASLIHKDADKAEDMTLKLSKLFRYSINTQSENLATITEELEIIKTYLDIEIVRFGERLSFSFDVEAGLDTQLIPRFILQPLVENALKHGLANRLTNGKLRIDVNRHHEMIEICVGDNGTPFPDQLMGGYGLESTYEKLNLLYQGNYEVQLINTPEKIIRIRIPA